MHQTRTYEIMGIELAQHWVAILCPLKRIHDCTKLTEVWCKDNHFIGTIPLLAEVPNDLENHLHFEPKICVREY